VEVLSRAAIGEAMGFVSLCHDALETTTLLRWEADNRRLSLAPSKQLDPVKVTIHIVIPILNGSIMVLYHRGRQIASKASRRSAWTAHISRFSTTWIDNGLVRCVYFCNRLPMQSPLYGNIISRHELENTNDSLGNRTRLINLHGILLHLDRPLDQ
jgi:hypothetical protein